MSRLDRALEILGLKPNASLKEVKQAYRKLAKIWHPDRFIDNPEKQKQAEEKFKIIAEAYEQLQKYYSTNPNATFTSEIYTQKNDAKTYYNEGAKLAESERYREAIEAFTLAIRLDPDYIQAYQYRGFILSKLGYEHRADADFQKAAELKLQQHTKSYYSPKSKQQLWRCKQTLKGHAKTVSCVAFKPKGQIFVSGSYDNNIKLWQLSTGKLLGNLRDKNRIRCIAISSDGRYIVSGSSDKTIKLWNAKTKQLIRIFGDLFSRHKDEVISVAITRNKKNIISGSADKTVKIWQLDTGKLLDTLTGFSAEVSSLAIREDGKVFVTGGLEKQLRIRNIIDGKVRRSLRGNSGVLCVAFSPDGKLLATGGFDRAIGLWDLKIGKKILTLEGHIDRVASVAFSQDGKTIVSGSWDKTIKLWKINTGEQICTLEGHKDKVLSVAISPDGNNIISSSADKTIKIWQKSI